MHFNINVNMNVNTNIEDNEIVVRKNKKLENKRERRLFKNSLRDLELDLNRRIIISEKDKYVKSTTIIGRMQESYS